MTKINMAVFKSRTCFDNHKKPNSHGKSTVCRKIMCCDKCFKSIKTGRVHFCGEVSCKICNSHQHSNHLCYVQPDTSSAKTDIFLFIFHDMETRQEKVVDEYTVEHEPNLCVFKQRSKK